MEAFAPLFGDIGTLAKPALFNLYFAFASIPLGFVLAVFVALGKASRNKLIAWFCRSYIYVFRGSPFFIQLFMFYSIMLAFNISVWRPWGIDWFVLHPLFLGPLILGLNTTAYTGEIFHGALMTVPRGEVEAARCFGMTRWQAFRSVIWPHLIRIAWPAYTNEVVFLFHATALIYFTLPVIDDQKDLMNKAGELFERDYNAVLHYSVAALYFLAISFAIFTIFGLVYRRLMRHLPQAPRVSFASRFLG
jgi:His/Glu/Gln/Arg/opine family amino acid ABC transporter permease subunit